MEDGRLSTVWSKFHLPMDLWPGILSRLPVKSLLRFRCVSKSWLALISDPDFVRLHLKNFKNNHQETHLLLVEGNYQDCHILCLDTFQTEAATLAKHGKYRVLFAVDGLVLLANWFTNLPGLGHVIVSNPSIRKCHVIPPEPEDSGCFGVEIGLGYDPLVKDYKLVNLVFDSVVRVAIYTLGAGSWKSILFQGKRCCSWHWIPYCIATKKVYLRGSLYFIACDLDTSVWELVSFDLSEEVFSSTSLPDCPFFRSSHFEGWLSLADGGCSLGVISFEPSSSSLWVLESSGDGSESVCWTKRYLFSVAVTEFLHITKKGGALILQRVKETSADAKDGFNRVISYDLETEEEKILLQIESDQVLNIYGLYDYVESLIMLD